MINWKVRIKSKTFWLTFIPAALLLIQQILAMFGIRIDITEISKQLLDIVDTVFILLACLGVIVDHTTKGIKDSDRALNYNEPK